MQNPVQRDGSGDLLGRTGRLSRILSGWSTDLLPFNRSIIEPFLSYNRKSCQNTVCILNYNSNSVCKQYFYKKRVYVVNNAINCDHYLTLNTVTYMNTITVHWTCHINMTGRFSFSGDVMRNKYNISQ